MEEIGRRLVRELKAHVFRVMEQIDDCRPEGQGVSYRIIEELAGLGLKLPAQDGWVTWSLLASLVQSGEVDVIREGRRLRWRLASTRGGH